MNIRMIGSLVILALSFAAMPTHQVASRESQEVKATTQVTNVSMLKLIAHAKIWDKKTVTTVGYVVLIGQKTMACLSQEHAEHRVLENCIQIASESPLDLDRYLWFQGTFLEINDDHELTSGRIELESVLGERSRRPFICSLLRILPLCEDRI